MGELIPLDQICELQHASEVKFNVAKSADIVHEVQQIAHAINNAANTGNFSCLYNHEISEEAKSDLEDYQYELHKVPDSVHTVYEISWRNASLK